MDLFFKFNRQVSRTEIPNKFTFPFFYQPHPLAIEAAKMVMEELQTRNFEHNFGIQDGDKKLAIGKMFGVLIVENKNGEIGYLKGFSGKLGNKNHHEGYVPPIFDMLDPKGFYITGEDELNEMNKTIIELESDFNYKLIQKQYKQLKLDAENEILSFKSFMKEKKTERDIKRKEWTHADNNESYEELIESLKKESLHYQFLLKVKQKEWNERIQEKQSQLNFFEEKITKLKDQRKQKSNQLQKRLFDQYNFLNINNETINVRDLFNQSPFNSPPSGAGECATPKMLQYAFQNNLKPLAMAEFWWGKSPTSEIRKHMQFYPACRGKCEPILGFMLKGIELDENPILTQSVYIEDLKIIYEDEHIVVIDKPAEMLSVPGKNFDNSVLSVLQKKYPFATGPILVHRLDMSTSGILIAAKSKEVHQNIQAQFIKKTVKKKYKAILEGKVNVQKGTISLPLRVDLDNRPHQLVCYEYGKNAETYFEVRGFSKNETIIYFYPITGRTHQLRVHSSHPLGLNAPIKGDDLYGNPADRLYLHAETLTIKHPITKKIMEFTAPAPF